MVLGPPRVDPHTPPADLDRLIDWFDDFAYGLVLLEEYSLEEIRAALDALGGPVNQHCRPGRVPGEPSVPGQPGASDLPRLLVSDHERFRTSIEQLEWLYAVLVHENHGGHRQALGQYGRAFVESFRRHRADERLFGRSVALPSAGPASPPASGKRY